jgi:hypothetical protein
MACRYGPWLRKSRTDGGMSIAVPGEGAAVRVSEIVGVTDGVSEIVGVTEAVSEIVGVRLREDVIVAPGEIESLEDLLLDSDLDGVRDLEGVRVFDRDLLSDRDSFGLLVTERENDMDLEFDLDLLGVRVFDRDLLEVRLSEMDFVTDRDGFDVLLEERVTDIDLVFERDLLVLLVSDVDFVTERDRDVDFDSDGGSSDDFFFFFFFRSRAWPSPSLSDSPSSPTSSTVSRASYCSTSSAVLQLVMTNSGVSTVDSCNGLANSSPISSVIRLNSLTKSATPSGRSTRTSGPDKKVTPPLVVVGGMCTTSSC